MNKKRLIREQLDASLKRLSPLRSLNSPSRGWIKAIRSALGMTARQLAERLGIAQQAVNRIERDELSGSVTIKTMQRVAEALDCDFICGFIPRTTLEDTVRLQAEKKAAKRLDLVSHTMKLEDQGLHSQENNKILSDMVAELVEKASSNLWNE